jgi:tetratricopeptide (TPR) repeat protein
MRAAQYAQSLLQAKKLHRAGQLGAAREAYQALIETAPQDGDLLGLLGVLALQEDRHEECEALLRAALKTGGDARIRLRNLNNLLALLQKTGDSGRARDLLEGGVPAWPEGAVPDAAERGAILSLGTALLLLDHADEARRLLEQAFRTRPGGPASDPELAGLTGRICLALGETEPAARLLEQAAAAAEAGPETLIAHGYVQQRVGPLAGAGATLERIARRWPVHAPARRAQGAAILVLNPVPAAIVAARHSLHDMHFNANFPAQLATALVDEFQFQSVFAELPGECLPHKLPQADVILNNCVNAEQMNVAHRGGRVLDLVARAGLPVINHPDAVIATTRQKVAALLADIPNLRVPRIERYQRELGPPETIAADIEDRFAYPVILRTCQSHSSAKLQAGVLRHRVRPPAPARPPVSQDPRGPDRRRGDRRHPRLCRGVDGGRRARPGQRHRLLPRPSRSDRRVPPHRPRP